jgi:biopolymer transport protein ExbD
VIQHDPHLGEGDEHISVMPDLTTLLDIMFILLVFFILTAGASYRTLELKLPSPVENAPLAAAANKHRILEIRPSGYALDGVIYGTSHALKKAVKSGLIDQKKQDFVVAGDRSVSLERLLDILTFLEANGVSAANILMQKKGSS